MSDAGLRDLERRARAGDREARRRWRAGLLRLRDPRLDPVPGDVVRTEIVPHARPERFTRFVRKIIENEQGEIVEVLWGRVLWLYGPEDGAGFCYHPRFTLCSIETWRRRTRHGEVVRMAEERAPEDAPSDA